MTKLLYPRKNSLYHHSAERKSTQLETKWSDFQASKFNSNSQPYYVLLNPANEEQLAKPRGADYDPKSYYNFFQSAIDQYTKANIMVQLRFPSTVKRWTEDAVTLILCRTGLWKVANG